MARTTRSPLTRLQTLLQMLHAAIATTGRLLRAATANGRMHGRALVLARAVWLTIAALTVALFVASTAIWLGEVRGPCPPVPGVCVHGRVPPTVVHAFAALHLSVSFDGGYHLGLSVLFALGFAVVAALLFWRRSHDPLALYVSLALLNFGALSPFDSGLLDRLGTASPNWRLPVELLRFLGVTAFGILGYVFPDGRFAPRWTRLAAVAVALWFLPAHVWPDSPFSFSTWPGVAFFGTLACYFCSAAAAQVYRYRHVSTPRQRLQTKWVVYGFVAAGIGYLAGWLVVHLLLPPTLSTPQVVLADLAGVTLIYGSLLLIPICIGIAMLRYHLFDIDIIIRRTLIYSLVTGTLVSVYAVSSILLQAGFEALTGQGSALAVVGSTLVIAALFQPVRGRAQSAVDRRFYRRKYDAAQTLAAFSRTVQSEVDLARVTEHLLAVVEETMQPSQVSLWLARSTPQDEPDAWHNAKAHEAETVRVPKPVPLTDVFAVSDGPTG
jgi:hypothetical protein